MHTHAFCPMDSRPRRVNAKNKNTPSMHRPWRRNVTTSVVGLKTVTYIKISPKMVNPRDSAGEFRRKRIFLSNFSTRFFHTAMDISLIDPYHCIPFSLDIWCFHFVANLRSRPGAEWRPCSPHPAPRRDLFQGHDLSPVGLPRLCFTSQCFPGSHTVSFTRVGEGHGTWLIGWLART